MWQGLRGGLLCVLVAGVFAASASAEMQYVGGWNRTGTGGSLGFVVGIAVAPDGTVYLADASENVIRRYSATGTFLGEWGRSGSASGEFDAPQGIAVASNGNVYVADTDNNRIQRFSPTGVYRSEFGGVGSGQGQLRRPHGVAVAPNGSVYVADTGNQRVQRYSSVGNPEVVWGTQGGGTGQFRVPSDVAVATDGSVYVADTGNARVQRFGPDGAFETTWGSSGIGDGQFAGPRNVGLGRDGSVLVGDTNNDRAQRFDANGVFETVWGRFGTAVGDFISPHGIAGAPDGSVYVADTANDRVQRFADVEATLTSDMPDLGSVEPGSTSGPATVTVRNDGAVALPITAVGLGGSDPGQFALAGGDCPSDGRTLAVGATCTIAVIGTPSSGGVKSATVVVGAQMGVWSGSFTTTVTITGAVPGAVLAPGAHDFGSQHVAVGATAPHAFTLASSGTGPLVLDAIQLTGPSASQFAVDASDCPPTLAVGASCRIDVRFDPDANGPAGATLAVATNAGEQSASLAGTGVAAFKQPPVVPIPPPGTPPPPPNGPAPSPAPNAAPQANVAVRAIDRSADRFRLDARTSVDLDGRVVRYRWTAAGRHLARTASFSRRFAVHTVVRLTVTDDRGSSASATVAVGPRAAATSVITLPPQALFAADRGNLSVRGRALVGRLRPFARGAASVRVTGPRAQTIAHALVAGLRPRPHRTSVKRRGREDQPVVIQIRSVPSRRPGSGRLRNWAESVG